jgi:hypothetical protein
MDSYRFWDEMKTHIIQEEIKLQERLDKLKEK